MAGDPVYFSGDVYVAGTLAAANQTLPSNSVGNGQIQALAGISASKLQHQHQITRNLSNHGFDQAETRQVLHCVQGATGTIVAFKAWASTAAGAATTTTFDLYVNGASVLSSTFTLTNAQAAYVKASATIADADLVTGDVVEVVVTGSGTNEPQGVGCLLVVREDAQ